MGPGSTQAIRRRCRYWSRPSDAFLGGWQSTASIPPSWLENGTAFQAAGPPVGSVETMTPLPVETTQKTAVGQDTPPKLFWPLAEICRRHLPVSGADVAYSEEPAARTHNEGLPQER